MSDVTLRAAFKAKKVARDAISAEVALMDVRIRENRSITRYMEACQATNHESLHAANIQLAQTYMQNQRSFTIQTMTTDADACSSDDSSEGTSGGESPITDEKDEEMVFEHLAKICKCSYLSHFKSF
jgi:hypothetical protein